MNQPSANLVLLNIKENLDLLIRLYFLFLIQVTIKEKI